MTKRPAMPADSRTAGGGERILIVCSGGGHLTEASHLVERLNHGEIHWATPTTPQSRTLLDGETVWPITAVGPRELAKTVGLLPTARRLFKELRPTMVVSTGAAPAIPFLALAAMKGIPAHFVESMTRIDRPSLSGRIVAKIPTVRCHSQHDPFSDRWTPIGSPFDTYEVGTAPVEPVSINRVVVTVGTLRGYPFRSLLERLVQILPTDVEVLWQTGDVDLDGLPIDGLPMVPFDEMRTATSEADVIVGHAGCGTALDALAAGRMPVLVPRRSARGEHVDDHQVELAEHLARRGLAITAEADELTIDHLQQAADSIAHSVTTSPLVLSA